MVNNFVSEAKKIEEKTSNYTLIKNTNFDTIPYVYVYKGIKNKTAFPDFIHLCKLSEKKLKQYLCGRMKELYGENCHIGDGYIYCKGTVPVLLTAHMDTVHKECVQDFYEEVTEEGKHIISSPQGIGGDDRCGVYMILQIVNNTANTELPYLLFCEQEEIGGIGSDKFCMTSYINDLKKLKFLIELDRANAKDAVFYNDENYDFHDWIRKITGYKTAYGSFSDICNLSPACDIASVNLSCGYYKAHTLQEYVIVEEMLNTIKATQKLIEASKEVEPFEYVEYVSPYKYERGNKYYSDYFGSRWNDDYDDYDYYYSYQKKTKPAKKGKEEKKEKKYRLEVYFSYYDAEKGWQDEYWTKDGSSESECWMNFFFENGYICFDDVTDFDFYSIQ